LVVLICIITHLEPAEIHEPGNQLIFQASMFRTLNPAKSYGKEFCSTWCKASIKWHLNRH
jgi:hypothetical protein